VKRILSQAYKPFSYEHFLQDFSQGEINRLSKWWLNFLKYVDQYKWHDWACLLARYICNREFEGSNPMASFAIRSRRKYRWLTSW